MVKYRDLVTLYWENIYLDKLDSTFLLLQFFGLEDKTVPDNLSLGQLLNIQHARHYIHRNDISWGQKPPRALKRASVCPEAHRMLRYIFSMLGFDN